MSAFFLISKVTISSRPLATAKWTAAWPSWNKASSANNLIFLHITSYVNLISVLVVVKRKTYWLLIMDHVESLKLKPSKYEAALIAIAAKTEWPMKLMNLYLTSPSFSLFTKTSPLFSSVMRYLAHWWELFHVSWWFMIRTKFESNFWPDS